MTTPSSGLLPCGGTRDPFTSIIWYVRAPPAAVLEDIAAPTDERPAPSRTSCTGTLSSLLDRLEPAAIPSWKLLVVGCGAWTAVFTQGSDLSYLARLAARLQTLVVRTSSSPYVVRDASIVRHGDTAFWYWDGSDPDTAVRTRSIQATRGDHRWEWHAYGDPLPFEDERTYGRRLVRERFDLPLLNATCSAIGIARPDDDAYDEHGTLVEQDTSRWPRQPTGVPSAQWRSVRQPR